MVLFDISSEGLCERATCVSRHAPPWNITVSSYVRADKIILSFLSKSSQALEPFFPFSPIESGFVLWRRESYSLRLGIVPQTAGELLPLLGHIFSVPSRSSQRLEVIGWYCCRGCQNGHAWFCCCRCQKEHCQRVCGA